MSIETKTNVFSEEERANAGQAYQGIKSPEGKEHILSKTQDKVKEGYQKVKEDAHAIGEQVSDATHNLFDDAKNKAAEAQHCLEEQAVKLLDQVKQQPLTSLLVAGGVGFILASLLRK